MMAGTHVVIGSLAAAALFGPEPAKLGMAVLGSLVPDIDHPGSFVGRRLFFISYPLSALTGHRTVTHSLAGAAALTLAAAALMKLAGVYSAGLAAAFAAGYLSHLLADCLTKGGVPLFWPAPVRFGLKLIRTGSIAEWALLVVTLYALGTGWEEFLLQLKQSAGRLLS